MKNTGNIMKIALSWLLVLIFTTIIYVTVPFGPLIRETIYKSFTPKILETYPLKNTAFQIKEKYGTLLSNEGENGFAIYDISNPDSINENYRFKSGDKIHSFFESRNIVYLADGKNGVCIIDVKQPAKPNELSHVKIEGQAFDVAVSEHFLLVAAGSGGLSIIDMCDKKNPVPVTAISLKGSCQKVCRFGNLAIVGTDSAGIHFVDLENVTEPVLVKSIPAPGAVEAMMVYENYAYISCQNHGIKIFEISNIDNLKEVGLYPTKSPVHQMRFRNGFLFAANDSAGLAIINVNRPEKPELQRIYKTNHPIKFVYTRYYFAYISDNFPKAYYLDVDTGRNFVVYFVGVVLSLVLIVLIIYFIRSRDQRKIYNYFALLIIAGVYGYFLNGMLEIPIEAIHFLEYGTLSALIYFAFRNHLNDSVIFLVGAALVTIVGIGDELFQWVLPNRSWDIRDVGFNALSGGLVQLAIWLGIAPLLVKNRVTRKSIQVLKTYLLLMATIFAIILSLTPQNVFRITTQFPVLKFVEQAEPITEYGYKIFYENLGFFSRFEKNKLMEYDQKNAKAVAEILKNNYRTSYKEFLNIYTPGNAPFIHEMRVHIFRRDRYFQDKRFWVAYNENLILENFFSHSLESSLYKWTGGEMQQCKESLDEKKEEFYVSPVSENVITAYNLSTVWIVFLLIAGMILGLDFFLMSRKIVR